MKTLFALIFVEIMLAGTNIQLGCFGMPLELEEEGPENQSSRLTRSLHALQSRLCPEGSSSERCFYSQLSMFIRMHDSLMDPVALRNIGKRNLPTRKTTLAHLQNDKNTGYNLDIKPQSDLQTRLQDIRNIAGMIDILKNLLDDTGANESPEEIEDTYDQSVLFNPDEATDEKNNELENVILPEVTLSGDYGLDKTNDNYSLENVIAMVLGLNNNKGRNNNDLKSNIGISIKSPIEKRQLICTSSSTQRECFDNAFAYYVRLLKSLQSH